MSKLINRAQVLERLGNRSVSWLYESMARGEFPSPVKVGTHAVAWVSDEVDSYIASRIADHRVTLSARPRDRKRAA